MSVLNSFWPRIHLGHGKIDSVSTVAIDVCVCVHTNVRVRVAVCIRAFPYLGHPFIIVTATMLMMTIFYSKGHMLRLLWFQLGILTQQNTQSAQSGVRKLHCLAKCSRYVYNDQVGKYKKRKTKKTRTRHVYWPHIRVTNGWKRTEDLAEERENYKAYNQAERKIEKEIDRKWEPTGRNVWPTKTGIRLFSNRATPKMFHGRFFWNGQNIVQKRSPPLQSQCPVVNKTVGFPRTIIH